ncbi:MAG: ATP-grasp domain-containing protein [Planctomycetes bacterium]|nr:ATP-grasp domain-containing protein [Planctomycetota bacterium]MCB9884104.1 ATP-grasp domain-containing protein [Planctomycetota bacterium]
MRNVVLVAPYFSENMRHCVRCFASLPDVRLSVLSQESAARVPEDLRACIAAYECIGDPAHAANIIDGARAVAAQWGTIDRLEGYLETLQVPIAEARDAMDVDGMRAEAAKNCRDKNRMKDVLRKAGVPVARQALVHGIDDVRAFVATVGYPIVLKPLAGFGARNTQRVHDDASLATALNQLLPSAQNPVQAEEFVRGAEHTFEAVTLGGRAVWSSSTSYLPSPLTVLENAWIQYAVVLPREVQPPHVQAFAEINAKALAALGVRDALSHMEWFLRDDGSAVVSEVGARPPGANIMPLLAAGHGADPWLAWARLMVERTWQLPERQFAAGTVFLRAMGGGEVVRAVEGVEALRNRLGPTLHGMKLPRPGQPRSQHYEGDGWVIVRHPQTEGVMAALQVVYDTLRVR